MPDEAQTLVTPLIEPLPTVVDGLDEAQRRAVATTAGPVLLISGPGAGKTLTLAVAHFGSIVAEVQAQHFGVASPPPPTICKECDFRSYCVATGTIDAKVIA